jgi:hypothetical protein
VLTGMGGLIGFDARDPFTGVTLNFSPKSF